MALLSASNASPVLRPVDLGPLILVVLVGLAMRCVALVALPHTPESDELAYLAMASGLIRGTGIVDNMGNLAMYNAGYPLFAIAPVFAVFGEQVVAVRIANVVLGAISIVLCYFLARETTPHRHAPILAAGFWALYLPSGVYAVYIAKENLMIPLMLGLLWCSMRALHRPTWALAAVAGGIVGFLALVGNAALAILPTVALAFLLSPARMQVKTMMLAIMACIAIAVTAPWAARNAIVLGAPVLNTNGGFNLYLGNNPAATGFFVSIGDTPRGPTWNELRAQGEITASATLRDEAIAWITQHPGEFASLAVRKLAYFWLPPLHSGQGPQSTAERFVRAAWAAEFILLVGLAIWGLARPFRDWNRSHVLLWLAVGTYTAAHMVFYVIFRYREPMMPLICVLAAARAVDLRAVSRRLDAILRRPGKDRLSVE